MISWIILGFIVAAMFFAVRYAVGKAKKGECVGCSGCRGGCCCGAPKTIREEDRDPPHAFGQHR